MIPLSLVMEYGPDQKGWRRCTYLDKVYKVCVENNVTFGKDVRVGTNVVIRKQAKIGDGVTLHPFVFVGVRAFLASEVTVEENSTIEKGVRIGKQTRVGPYVRIKEDTCIGDNVTIGEHSRIGPGCGIGHEVAVGQCVWLEQCVSVPAGCTIGDKVTILPDTFLREVEYTKTPLQLVGTQHRVCVHPDGYVSIGCKVYPIKKWLLEYKRIGAQEGYTSEQIDEYGKYLAFINSLYGGTI